jgi:hypothetical protein
MAKYKEIGGSAVQFRSGAEEYTYPSPEGELFYNSSNNQFQFVGLGAGNWATGGNLNQARYAGSGGDGTLTAAIIAGGYSNARVDLCRRKWFFVDRSCRFRCKIFTCWFGTSSSALAVVDTDQHR